jgi:ComF family protein
MIKEMWRGIWTLLVPRICLRCGRRMNRSEHYLCAGCLSYCPDGIANPHVMESLEYRLRAELPLVSARSLYRYGLDPEARRLVFELKYHGKPETGLWMGRQLAVRLSGSGFFDSVDALVPVPLHPRKQRRRGYNQAEWIALGVADRTGLPLRTDAVRRTVFTHTQTHLDPLHRRRNVGHVFQPGNLEGLEGKHLLLIDDVITTGATITACAKALEAVKGIRVSVLSFAYAGPHH